uniref:preprotein translocase subunit SecA n=1 Tax=Gloiopeltis furcata TaxID=42017 RepID=UPI0028D33B7A|nr:preprotein translocase subunit SecA [Gloiopeltis furcata]WMP13842.1 preprotein translocase subunit SecA [Gloiopeltis furcata]
MFNFLIRNKFDKYKNLINKTKHFSQIFNKYTDNELKKQTQVFKDNLKDGASLDDMIGEVFGAAKEAIQRSLGLKIFDVQILGAIVLHEGKIAEMKTGEGKTIVAILPCYLNALMGKGVHVITVNDYLAKRDAELVKKVYKYLNISVGLIQQSMNSQERKQQYQYDITYITNNELGFDYLRDNMVTHRDEIVQTDFFFAIIDEVDSILIDEARTPLIISGPCEAQTDKYNISKTIAQKLVQDIDYEVDEKTRNVTLTEEGIIKCEQGLSIDSLYNINDPWIQYILNAVKAEKLFLRNINYIIKNQEIVIVDEFTGRIMEGRRWSDGLHQAIEAKENIKIQPENKTLASITYQNLFLLYKKLSGMTGTAKTEETELDKIYKIEVEEIPTNKTCQRKDFTDLVYKNEYSKWKAVANECYDMYKIGRPTLIGTTNVEKSEFLATILDKLNIKYNLLNAKPENVTREAEIITQAGRKSAITISTNMAGRGTDIVLGGNPYMMSKLVLINYLKNTGNRNREYQEQKIDSDIEKFLAVSNKEKLKKDIKHEDIDQYVENIINLNDPVNNQNQRIIKDAYMHILEKYKQLCKKEKEEVLLLGGLHVIGTERHESRRIDNQLKGRAGRQGDPGSSRFFLSLEDSLLRIFGGDKISILMRKLNVDADTPIESLVLSKSLDTAQKKVESYFYDIRKQLFDYDEVINSQRQAIYSERKRILQSTFTRDCIIEYAENTIDEIISMYFTKIELDSKMAILRKIAKLLNFNENLNINAVIHMNYIDLKCFLYEQLRISYDLRESYLEQLRPGLIRQLEKYYLLQQIDKAWQEHLEKMTILRESIGWRSYGQQDPLIEYKNEAFNLFVNMVTYIRQTVVYLMMRSRLVVTNTAKG